MTTESEMTPGEEAYFTKKAEEYAKQIDREIVTEIIRRKNKGGMRTKAWNSEEPKGSNFTPPKKKRKK